MIAIISSINFRTTDFLVRDEPIDESSVSEFLRSNGEDPKFTYMFFHILKGNVVLLTVDSCGRNNLERPAYLFTGSIAGDFIERFRSHVKKRINSLETLIQ